MNTMSLLRNSVIVGGATFLVGSAFMEIGKADSKSDIGKWPYIATFLSGALGFYLLKQNFIPVPKALELNAENFSKDFTFNIDIDEAIIENRDELEDRGYSDEDIEDLEEEILNNFNKDDILDQIKSDELDSIGGGTMDFDDEVYLKRRDGMVDDVEASIDYEVDAGDWNAETFASDEDRRLKAFAKKIENEKKKLVKKAKRSGLYENFGQKEVHKLEDSISDLDYYEQQKYQEMIRDFDDWANSIDLRGLERYAETFASETSSSLQSFAAEVFEADRKIRRRTRWTWKRGMENGFEWDTNIYPSYYFDTWEYKPEGAYHISDLPEGYHLHLYKPKRRSKNWVAYAKSPTMDAWEKFTSRNKAYLTPQLLQWYNLSIATPTKQEMSPIMQMLIDTGSASGDVKISRVVVPEVPKMRKMPDGTKQKVGVVTKEQIKFYATKPNEKPKLLATKSNREGYDFAMSESGFESLGVLDFMQGLAFIGSKAATTRSVNRFNKNREQWVKSFPAWFQNTVKNKINHLKLKSSTSSRFNNILERGSNIDIYINDVTVATINRGERFYSRRNTDSRTEFIEDFEKLSEPKIKVMGEEYPPIFILNEDGELEQPRPSTQRKIYQNSMVLQDDGTYKVNKIKFVMELADRYKFETQTWLNKSMTPVSGANLDDQSRMTDSLYQPIMKTMLRRFKKNLN